MANTQGAIGYQIQQAMNNEFNRKGRDMSAVTVVTRVKVAGDERYHDEPDKNSYSHVVEAGEYGLLGGGEGHAAVKRKQPTVKITRYRPSSY